MNSMEMKKLAASHLAISKKLSEVAKLYEQIEAISLGALSLGGRRAPRPKAKAKTKVKAKAAPAMPTQAYSEINELLKQSIEIDKALLETSQKLNEKFK